MRLRICFGLLGAWLVVVAPCAAGGSGRAPQVRVVAGEPFEFSFVLSPSVISRGRVVFEVRNAGLLRHRFKVCSRRGSLSPNYCAGAETGWILPGSSAKLIVFFDKEGTYEYLCGVRGHAAAGMKGLLTVR